MKFQETVLGGLTVEQEILLEHHEQETFGDSNVIEAESTITISAMMIKQSNWPGKSLIRVQHPMELSVAIQLVDRQIEKQRQKFLSEIQSKNC